MSPQANSYATSSPIDSKPPITLNGLDGTYAIALYTAAAKTQTLESTARAINDLKRLYERDQKLSTIMQAPSLNVGDKSAIIAELQKHTGDYDKSNIVKNFLRTVAEYNRLGLLKDICDKFGEVMSAARGEIEVTVISATPVDSKNMSKIETAISKSNFIGQGKKLKVKNTVKPDIIGGLIVEIGDRTIDLSVLSRLAKMNKLLTEPL